MTIDNPTLATLDTLKRLDADPPGTWLAQPKYDGWRRWYNGQWHSKHSTGPASKPMPKALADAFLAWYDSPSQAAPHPSFDCEWIGPRHSRQDDKLVLFDLLTDDCFLNRYVALNALVEKHPLPPNITLAPVRFNPSLVSYFESLAYSDIEGIVVRRADSLLTGGTNPLWYKVKFK